MKLWGLWIGPPAGVLIDNLPATIKQMGKNGLIKNYAYYVGSSFGSLPVNFIKNLVLARVLLPAEYGLLATLNLFITYNKLSHLGIRYGFDMRYPALQSQGKFAEGKELLNSSFSLLSVLALLVSGSCVMYGLLTFGSFKEMSWSFGILVFGVSLFFDEIYEFIMVYFHTQNLFARLSFLRFLFNAASGILSIVGVYRYGLNGAIAATGISFLFFGGYALYHFFVKAGGSFSFSRSAMFPVLSLGFPFIVTQVINTAAGSLDRFIILALFSTAGLGIYSNAMLYVGLLVGAGSAVSYVINTAVIRVQASQPDKNLLGRLFVIPFKTLKYALPVAQLLSWLLFPRIILLLTPKYAASSEVVKILVFGTSYGVVMAYCAVIYVALSRQWELMGINIVSAAVMTGSLGFTAWMGGDMETMALAAVIAQICNVAFCLYTTCRNFYSVKRSLWYIIEMQSLQVIIFLSVLIGQYLLPFKSAGMLVVMALFCATLALLAYRETVRAWRDAKLLLDSAKP